VKRLIAVATLALLATTSLIAQSGCSQEPDRMLVHIDWVDFIKFNDITYVRRVVPLDAFAEENLEYYERTKSKLADNVDDLDYRSKNGDAAYLEEGTLIYSIKGYSPDFRLIARTETEMRLYEADTNPHARKGADLLDIGGKVEYIGINSPIDGETELASIREESLVSSLVEMVLDAPVDQTVRSTGGRQLFIAFYLSDGTVANRSFRPDDRLLSRGIMVPDEFSEIVESTAP
jgi:hypothetical protein